MAQSNSDMKQQSTVFDSPDYKRSRKAYIGQCTFEYFITILAGDVFLAKLLADIGLSDSLIGIISSFITVAFLFQLCSIFVVQRIRNIKRTVIFFNSLSQLLFMSLYFIPFLPFSKTGKTVSVVACILLAYFGNYFVSSILFKWANSYVDPAKRASYSAGKEKVSLITGMVFTLIIGKVIDKFESLDNIRGGFLFTAIAILILSICNFISLLMIKNDTTPKTEAPKIPFKEVLLHTLGNRCFLNVVLMTCLYEIGRFTTAGFLGIYKTKDLLISVGTVQIINIVGNLFRFFLSKPFGKYSDRTSYASGLKLGYFLIAIGFFINIFTTPKTWWLIIPYTVISCVSMAGTNQNSMNIIYSYVEPQYFVQATAIKNSIGGICGFLASLVGSKILSAVQSAGNTVFGLPMYGQQLLSAISCVLIIITILFVQFVVEKQKVIKQ